MGPLRYKTDSAKGQKNDSRLSTESNSVQLRKQRQLQTRECSRQPTVSIAHPRGKRSVIAQKLDAQQQRAGQEPISECLEFGFAKAQAVESGDQFAFANKTACQKFPHQ